MAGKALILSFFPTPRSTRSSNRSFTVRSHKFSARFHALPRTSRNVESKRVEVTESRNDIYGRAGRRRASRANSFSGGRIRIERVVISREIITITARAHATNLVIGYVDTAITDAS